MPLTAALPGPATAAAAGPPPPRRARGAVLWKTLEQWQKRAGLGTSLRTDLDELARIQSADVVLPLADGSGRELRIRCVMRPDKAQALLIDRLGLRLPEPLRIPTRIDKM